MADQIVYTGDPLLFNDDIEDNIETFSEYNEGNLPDFLDFHSSFPRTGKQGILGLLIDRKTNRKYVYKIGQYLNFLVHQEHAVMNGLNSLRDYCPHFCKTYGRFKTKINENYRKVDNPFEIEHDDDKMIKGDVLLMENIDESRKLYRYIKNKEIVPEVIMSIVKQTLIANIIAGEHVRFSHYDMHSNNVLIKKCPVNSVFFYILDENRTYIVPTYGYYPIIIDFGFSFNKECEGKPMYGALAHTDIGFIPSIYDQHTDAKLFLTSVSYEMKKYKKSDISTTFRSLVHSIYEKCNVDLECGWDQREDDLSISDQLLKKMTSQFKRSAFLTEQGHHVVDLLQVLVELPLSSRHTNDTIEDMVSIFVTEFLKIEREISSDFYNIYILKTIIESCVKNKYLYLSKNSREEAVNNFKKDILESIDEVVKFCNPKINWEKLLCGLLCLSKCIENYCSDKLKKLVSLKKSDYNNMILRNTTDIYEAIEANIPSHFFFDQKTQVYVWDCQNKRNYKTTLQPNVIDRLNKTHPFERGIILYEYLS
jgi:hypothetical protein